MTVRELRHILFEVENQQLTVEELRAILFNVDEQDEELKAGTIAELTRDEEA